MWGCCFCVCVCGCLGGRREREKDINGIVGFKVCSLKPLLTITGLIVDTLLLLSMILKTKNVRQFENGKIQKAKEKKKEKKKKKKRRKKKKPNYLAIPSYCQLAMLLTTSRKQLISESSFLFYFSNAINSWSITNPLSMSCTKTEQSKKQLKTIK